MEENKNYISGIIGALIGGLVASIPWILMYVYGEMIFSVLAIIIAVGALKGYQFMKGKINEKLPAIIVVVSLVCVTVSTLLIIPFLLMANEGIPVNIENLKILYEYDEFFSAIMKDYMISLFFTFLGISGVVNNIRKQIYEGETQEIKWNVNNPANQEQQEIIKNAFIKLNALDKASATSKESIFNELDNSDLKLLFNNLKQQQIIRKYKGKYYYSLENEKNFGKRFLLLFSKIMLAILIVIIFMILIVSLLV